MLKINNNTPSFKAHIVNPVTVRPRGGYNSHKSNIVSNIREFFGDIFHKSEPDYDEFIQKSISQEEKTDVTDMDLIDKILMNLY